jgi:hypothetical protein
MCLGIEALFDLCIGYSTIETKEASGIGYNGFLFPHSYSGDGLGATHLGLHPSTHAEKETRYIQYTSAFTRVLMRKKKPVISNTGKFFCFNNNVSNLEQKNKH